MKIAKVISDCIECEYLYSDGIGKDAILYCVKNSICNLGERFIPETGIPDWCPLEDYKEQTK